MQSSIESINKEYERTRQIGKKKNGSENISFKGRGKIKEYCKSIERIREMKRSENLRRNGEKKS